MIRYDRLWKTMEEKGFTQYRLIKQHSFSAGQIGRLKKNMHVSTHTIETLCGILQCGVGDIIEFWPDDVPWPSEEPAEAPGGALLQKEDKPKTGKAAAKVPKVPAEETAKPEKISPKPEKVASKKSGKAKAEKQGKEKPPKPEKEKKAGKGEKGKKDKSEKKNKNGKKK